jgi:RNA polymerase sigma-70 factor, ECF subfamily
VQVATKPRTATKPSGPDEDGQATLAPDARVPAPLRALIDAHYASIWRLLLRFGVPEEQTDDAAQEVFWIAARRLTDIKPGSEAAFLYGVAIRVAARTRQHRELGVLSTEALDTVVDDQPSQEDLLDERRARELLGKVLAAMPEPLREVFVLFELQEIEIPTIAEILAIPVGTVGSRLRRAREEFSSISKRVRAQSAFRGGLP